MNYRVIFYHKQETSARTRFLKFANSVCCPESLPKLSQIVDITKSTLIHPSSIISDMITKYGFEPGTLEAEGDFIHLVETPRDIIQVVLIRVTTIDPPFTIAEANQAEFVELMKTFGLPQVEMKLLRSAYELIMGD